MRVLAQLTGVILILASCQVKEPNNIICKIEGVGDDFALIGFLPQSDLDKEIIDTVQFFNGQLAYNYPVDELHEVIIIPFSLFFEFENGNSYPLPASRIKFFLDKNDQIKIEGIVEDNCVDYQVKGNHLSEQLTVARKMKIPLFKERIIYEFAYNSKDEANRSQPDEDAYWNHRRLNNKKYAQQNISYIQNNPDAEYSARLLLEIRDKEKAIELYNSLTQSVKNCYFGIIMEDMINGWVLTTPGILFPNIIGETIFNKNFSLSDFRGKYVLIDFWGSWCAPCLAEIPKLAETNERYKHDFVIVGIACNDNRERLLKTVENNGINWIQIIDGITKETKYSQNFGIQSYPTKVLLDKDGKVIKTYIGLDESVFADLDSLLGN